MTTAPRAFEAGGGLHATPEQHPEMPIAAVLLAAVPAPPPDAYDGLHSAILSPGDLNGDGMADVVAAERRHARGFGAGRGHCGNRVYALSGADGTLLWARAAPGGFGSALTDAGDLDGDGVHDVAVARSQVYERAPVLVLSGATGEVILTVRAPAGVADMGRALAGGRDATCDGIPDLLVGARGQALIVDGVTGRAVASVAFVAGEIKHPDGGTSTGTIPRIRPTVHGTDGLLLAQPAAEAPYLGCGVAWLPDQDGDGRAEVAVGSVELFLMPLGRTYVVASADPERTLILSNAGWSLEVLDDVDGDGSPELAASTPAVDVAVYGLDDGRSVWRLSYTEHYGNQGTSLAGLPDVDGDGAPELLLGAHESGTECGFAAIYSGRTGASLRGSFELPSIEEVRDPESWNDGCRSALDAAALPDLDGGGAPEMAVHLAPPGEVRVLSTTDGSVRWIVALEPLAAAAQELGSTPERD